MSDPLAELESSSLDDDSAECNSPDGQLSWEHVVDHLRREHPDRITQADVARILLITPQGIRHHLPHLGEVKWLQVGGRSFRTYDRKTVLKYARSRRKIRISECRFKGIEVERLERICETYVRQNLDIAPPELLALAKRIAKL